MDDETPQSQGVDASHLVGLRRPGTFQPPLPTDPPMTCNTFAWAPVPRLATAAGACLAALVLSACSGSGSSSEESHGAATSGSIAPVSPTADARSDASPAGSPPSSDPSEQDTSPVEGWSSLDVLGALEFLLEVGGRESAVAAYATNVPEDDVLECMTDRGFTYVKEATPDELADQDPRFSMSPSEYAETYGLGISAIVLDRMPTVEPTVNEQYLFTLSGSEADAYAAALSACKGATPERTSVSTALTTAVEIFRPIVDDDVAVIDATKLWRECMSEQGFTFDSPQAMRERFWDSASSATSVAAREAIFADEIRVAQANVDCQATYEETYLEVLTSRLDEFETILASALANPQQDAANG